MGLFKTKKPEIVQVEVASPEPPEAAETAPVKSEEVESKQDDDTGTEKTAPNHADNYHSDAGEDEDDDDIDKVQEWDEGGRSHCGYHATVHETLMSVGESVHGVVGEPSERVDRNLNMVANWFQEASYAVRDFLRGDASMSQDMKDMFMGSKSEEDGEHKTATEGDVKPTESAAVTSS